MSFFSCLLWHFEIENYKHCSMQQAGPKSGVLLVLLLMKCYPNVVIRPLKVDEKGCSEANSRCLWNRGGREEGEKELEMCRGVKMGKTVLMLRAG